MWAWLNDASCQEEGRKEHEEHEEHDDKGPCASDDSERHWWLLGTLALGVRFVDAALSRDVGEFNCSVSGGNLDVGRAGIVDLCVSPRS